MLYIFQKEDHLSSYKIELKHLNLVDEPNVQINGVVSKKLHHLCSMSTKELYRPESNRLCTQLNDAKYPETQTIYTAAWKAYIMVT